MTDSSSINNAKLRAELTEQVRSVVREELAPVVSRLDKLEDSLGTVRQDVGKNTGTLKFQSALLIAVIGGLAVTAFGVFSRSASAKPTAMSPETLKGTPTASVAPSAAPRSPDLQLAALGIDAGREMVPGGVTAKISKKCSFECKHSLVPINCATYCASNMSWTWCLRLQIAEPATLRRCVSSAFHGSTGRGPLKSLYDDEPPQLPEGGSDASRQRGD